MSTAVTAAPALLEVRREPAAAGTDVQDRPSTEIVGEAVRRHVAAHVVVAALLEAVVEVEAVIPVGLPGATQAERVGIAAAGEAEPVGHGRAAGRAGAVES
jgi:hypothetical protein